MDQEELKHLVNVELHPSALMFELSKCGIHLLPEDGDAERGGIHLKDKGAEERAILDIAQTLKVFAFQSIKWNQQCSADSIVCRMRTNADYFREFFEDAEDDWETLQWWNNKVCFIDAKNSDEEFKTEIKKGQVTHSMLSLAVKHIAESKGSVVLNMDAAEQA